MKRDEENIVAETAVSEPPPKRMYKAIVFIDPTVSVVSCGNSSRGSGMGGFWKRGAPYRILTPGERANSRLKQTIQGQPLDVPQLDMVDALELQRQHRITYWEVVRDSQGNPILKADGSPRMRQCVKDCFQIVDIEED